MTIRSQPALRPPRQSSLRADRRADAPGRRRRRRRAGRAPMRGLRRLARGGNPQGLAGNERDTSPETGRCTLSRWTSRRRDRAGRWRSASRCRTRAARLRSRRRPAARAAGCPPAARPQRPGRHASTSCGLRLASAAPAARRRRRRPIAHQSRPECGMCGPTSGSTSAGSVTTISPAIQPSSTAPSVMMTGKRSISLSSSWLPKTMIGMRDQPGRR